MSEATDANTGDGQGPQEPQQDGESISLEDAKRLVREPEIYSRPIGQQQAIWDSLATHYGLVLEPPKPNESHSAAEPRGHDFKDGIRYAIMLEDFGVDPFSAINEFRSRQWGDELSPFMQMLDPLVGERRTVSGGQMHFDRYSFFNFILDIEKAVRYKKADDLRAEAEKEKERILRMTPQEWDKYRQGLRYHQGARADEVYQEMVRGIRYEGSPFVGIAAPNKEADMLNFFLNLQTAKSLIDHSEYQDGHLVPQPKVEIADIK